MKRRPHSPPSGRDEQGQVCLLESLEPRLLLSGTPVDAPISEDQGISINTGLYSLGVFCGQIDNLPQTTQALPFSDYALGNRLNAQGLVYKYICLPVADYFNTDSTPTTGELVQVLKGLSLAEQNVTVTVDPAKISGGQVGNGLFEFNLAIDLVRRDPTSIWLTPECQAAGLQMYPRPQGVQDTSLHLDLSFGLEPGFYVAFHSLVAGAEVQGTGISGALDVGFLGTQVHDGQLRANMDYALGLIHPHLHGDQLQSVPLADEISNVLISSSLDGTLPVHADFGDFSASGNPVITLASDDILAVGKTFVTFNADAAEISRFRNLNAGAALNMISQYGTALAGIANGGLVNKDIAFADAGLGQLLDLNGALQRQVVGPLKQNGNVPAFHNAQQLDDLLQQVLGLSASVVQAHYNPATHILSYHLVVHDTAAPVQANVSIDNVDAFSVISGNSTVTLAPASTIEFDLEFDLGGQQAALTAKNDAPAMGRLSGDAHFSLQLAGGTALNVVVAADPANNSLDDLVADINIALAAAGLSQKVHAGRSGNRLTLTTICTGPAFIKIAFSNGDKASELGFTAGQLAQDSFSNYTYVENASLDATVHATGTGIHALGRLGFLDVDIKNGTLTGTTGVDLQLKDLTTGTAGGRVSLGGLLDHLAPSDLGSVITAPTWSGSSSLALPLRANPNIFGANHPADPRVTLTASSNAPHGIVASYNADMAPLRAFEHIGSPEILAAVTNIKNFIAGLGALPDMSQKLPLINKAVGEMFDLASLVSVPDHPILSIQVLAQELRAALDIPAGDLSLTYSGGVLHITAKVTRDVTEALPLFMDLETYAAAAGGVGQLEGLKSLVDQAGAAKLPVQAHLALQMNMGIDFGDPLHPRTFLEDTTVLDMTVKAGGSGLNFTFTEGPLVLQVKGGSANLDGDGVAATTGDAAHVSASLVDDNSDGRHYFDELTTADAQVNLTAQAHASLPIYYPTASDLLGTLSLAITDVEHPAGNTTLTSPDIVALFASCDLANNMGSTIDGLDSYFTRLNSALDAQALGRSFPLVGGELAGRVTFLADIRASVVAALHAQLDGKMHQSSDLVREALVQALGPSGLGVLDDRDGNGVIDVNDIQVITTDLDNDGQADDQVQLSLSLHKALTAAPSTFDVDLALPALGLTEQGKGNLSVGYDMSLSFGVNKTDGFYVDTSAADEMNIAVDASIADMSAPGYLSYLPLVVSDEDADGNPGNAGVDVDQDGLLPSRFVGTFHVDVADTNDRLTYAELSVGPNPAAMVSATLDAQAAVNLDLLETFGNQTQFPRIRSQFHMDWTFTAGDADLAGQAPTVALNKIGLNLSDFFTQFVTPVLNQVYAFCSSSTDGPMGKIVSFLNSPIPVLSQLSQDLGNGPIDLLDTAKFFGSADKGFLTALTGLGSLRTLLTSTIASIDPNLWIDMGGLDFAGIDLRPRKDLSGVSPHVTPPATDPMSQLPAAASNFLTAASNVGDSGAGMSFSLLQSGVVHSMLLGHDASLFSFTMPKLDVSGEYDTGRIYIWELPPVYVQLKGSVDAHINIGPFDFDTYGLRKALQNQDPTEVFSGFYVSGASASLATNIMATGGVDLAVASVEVSGGIYNNVTSTLTTALKDPNQDGITRMDEVLSPTRHGLMCSFNSNGMIVAGVKIEVTVGWGPLSYTFTVANFPQKAVLDFTCCNKGNCLPDRFDESFGQSNQHLNDTMASATDIGAAPGIHIKGVSISADHDQDWYYFDLVRPDSIDIKLKERQSFGNLDFAVLDDQGNILGHSSTLTDLKVVTLENLPAGKYYVHVYGYGLPNLYQVYVEPSKRSETIVFYVNPADVTDPTLNSYYTFAPGNGANDGTTPWSPLSNVAEVLSKHSIGPHSMIVVDSGTYKNGFTLTHDKEGAAYAGSPGGSTFDVAGNILTLDDSDNNLVCYLHFIGKAVALKILGDGTNDSADNIIRSNYFGGNNTAMLIQSDQHNLIAYNTISGAGFGISLPLGAAPEIRNNDIHSGTVGVELASRTAAIFDNDIYGNKVGLSVTGILGFPSLQLAEPNRVRDNQTGVLIPAEAGEAVVRFTRIYDNHIGLNSHATASRIYGNDVYGNDTGMQGIDVFGPEDWADVLENRIHENGIGVEALAGATVRYNRVYANHSGVRVESSYVGIHHNLIYRNLEEGVYLLGSDHVSVMNNTIFAPQGQGIYLDDWTRQTTIRNNIVWAQQGFDLKVETDSQAGLDTDYNNYYSSGTGQPVWYQKPFADLYDWQVESYFDRHSIGYTVPAPALDDPLFLDVAGDDYHLTPLLSSSIDAGDPASPCGQEPSPNGGRIDLGAYGNTTQAAASPQAYLKIEYPNFYTDWQADQGHEIRWHSYGLSGNVQLAIYQGGAKLADIATVSVSAGSYVWSPSAADIVGDSAQRYVIRITSEAQPSVSDQSREPFSVPSDGHEFYVDDADNTNDAFTPLAAGNNRNTGKTPLDPKANFMPILLMYDLGPGDRVNIDAGQYMFVRNAVISGDTALQDDDEGAAFTGPANPAQAAVIDRGNMLFQDTAAFDINNGDYVTLSHLAVKGGWYGVYAHNSSTNFHGEYLTATDNRLDGIHVESDSAGTVLSYLQASANQQYGIYVDAPIASLSDSRAFGNGSAGFYVSNAGNAVMENNEAFGNGTGMIVSNGAGTWTVVGNADLSAGRGNRVHDNLYVGIKAYGNVRVVGNVISNQAQTVSHSGIGLYMSGGVAELNVLFNNDNGVWAGGSQVLNNRVYGGVDTGIWATGSTLVSGNVVYSYDTGIEASPFNGSVLNNLVYGNLTTGLLIRGGSLYANNTVYQPQGTAVRVDTSAQGVVLRNNIIYCGDSNGYGIYVASDSQNLFASDFNLIYTDGAKIGYWQNAGRLSLANWQNATFGDAQSISQDPRFADVAGAGGVLGYHNAADDGRDDDFHLLSPYGYIAGGSLAPVLGASGLPEILAGQMVLGAVMSPAIDRGRPGDTYNLEPAPNGGYIDLGAYGNTAQASRSPLQYMLLTSPDGGQNVPIGQKLTVRWRSHDQQGTVSIDLLQQGNPTPVAQIAAAAANTGEFIWTIPDTVAAGVNYTVRVRRSDGPEDVSNTVFSISPPISAYYVNDSTVGSPGDWCSVAGDDSSDGLTPLTPMASIRGMLQKYTLGAGTIIRVDSGTYDLTANIIVTSDDSGVRIEGNPLGQAVLDRGNTSSTSRVFELQNADNLQLDHLSITGGYIGIYAAYNSDSDGLQLTNCQIYDNSYYGIDLETGNDGAQIQGSRFWGTWGGASDDDQPGAIVVRCNDTLISGNIVFNTHSTGIDVSTGVRNQVIGNTLHDVGTGISVYFSGGAAADRSTITDNTVYNITSVGISANNVLVSGNVVHDVTNTYGFGLWGGSIATGNTVYNSPTGMMVGGSSIAGGNRVYGCTYVGLELASGGSAVGNTVYSNATGIRAAGAATNNLVYANSVGGIVVTASGSGSAKLQIANNTVYQESGDALRIGSGLSYIRLRNNILWSAAGSALNVPGDSLTNFESDYNLLYASPSGHLATGNGIAFDSVMEWWYAIGTDSHSISADPQFVNYKGIDNLLGYVGGHDYGTDDNFHLATSSPGVDSGDPLSLYLTEPDSGGRVNMGSDGNTPLATSRGLQALQVLAPNGNEKLQVGRETTISWQSFGLGLVNTIALIDAGSSTSVDNWISDSSHGSSGNLYNTVNISGVADAAPASVYVTYASCSYGLGNELSYSLAVPDGAYTIRLHFADYQFAGQRQFNIKLNGVVVQSNFDVAAAAGGSYKAVARSFDVTASGGAGIMLELVNATASGAGAMVSGIELTQANPLGVASPTANVEASYDNGATWSPVASNVAMDRFGRGSVAWTPAQATSGNAGKIRVSAASIADLSDNAFLVAPQGHDYYVNDQTTAGDVLTTSLGNNANNGKTPWEPMASVSAVLAAYKLGPLDVIHVDAGTYNLTGNLLITGDDSGATISGSPTTLPVFNRGNTGSGSYVFQLQGTSDVTLDHLAITGGYAGVMAASQSGNQRMTVSDCVIYGNWQRGIYIEGAPNSTITGNTLYNDNTAITVYAPGTTVSGNGVYGNASGIVASYTFTGDASVNTIHILANDVHNNTAVGISGDGQVEIAGNNVYGQTTYNTSAGINVNGAAVARNNIVHGNSEGIYSTGSMVSGNSVFGNTVAGIYAIGGTVEANTVYGNATGILAGGTCGTIANNLIYGNSLQGLWIDGTSSDGKIERVLNNTLYQPQGDALRVTLGVSNLYLRNNIFWAEQGYALNFSADSFRGLDSDYNLIYSPNPTKMARWGAFEVTHLADWYYELNQDGHSLSGNPLFADAAGGNFLLQSASPAIDAGDPQTYYLREPQSNGGRVNLGNYGNTPLATTSPDRTVQVLSPNGLEKLKTNQPVQITWGTSGLASERPVALINAGGVTTSNWLYDNYRTSGSTLQFGLPVSLAGVSDPAPADVYQTYVSAEYGVGNALSYNLPAPDGQYTLRLHFATNSDLSRKFDIVVNGVVVAVDFDIAARAGGAYKATIAEFDALATGGTGLDVRLVNKTNNPAMLCGIELLQPDPAGSVSPTADAEVSLDNGQNWAALAIGSPLDRYGRGSVSWTPSVVTEGNTALVRVRSGAADDTSDRAFGVGPAGSNYYVNNRSTAGDVYATALGDNANSGLTPDKPMVSLAALLAAYDLGAGDTVYVDAGTYALLRNVLVAAGDSGVHIVGPLQGAAILDRANTSAGSYGIELAAATDVVLDHLEVTGAVAGIYAGANSASDRLVVSHSRLHGNQQQGLYVAAGNNDVQAIGNVVYGNTDGIAAWGQRMLVSANEVYGNSRYGVEADASMSTANHVTISQNTVHNNDTAGIYALYSAQVVGNRVYNHAGSGRSGITIGAGVTARDNTVYNNYSGIQVAYTYSTGCLILGNRAYANTNGVYAYGNTRIEANRLYNNNVGVYGSGLYGQIVNNLIYANSEQGVLLWNSNAPQVVNNTIYQGVGDAVRLTNNTRNVSLRNNILFADVGYDLYVASDSRTGLAADYNLYHLGIGPAHVGSWNGVALDTLAAWQSASGQDAHGLQGNPKFVNTAGADGVLGYTIAGDGVDAGLDDNFTLKAGSPAIDRAEASTAPVADMDGNSRVDDPATPNLAGGGYVQTTLPTSLFAVSGASKNWRADDSAWSLTLPFAFSFYGTSYSSVMVSSNGLLQFAGSGSASSYGNSVSQLIGSARIAAYWCDLRTDNTGDDIFVDTSLADRVTIRWNATIYSGGGDANFAVTLFADGRIRMDYGPGNASGSPTIGISKGDGVNYILSPYNGMNGLGGAASVQFGAGSTFVDIGACEFQGSGLDITPPVVTSTFPKAVDLQGITGRTPAHILVNFSEALNSIDAQAAGNYQLIWAGSDDALGTADDLVYAVNPTYVSGSSQVALDGLSGAAMPQGKYRLIIRGATLHDLSGLGLDGDQDGVAGGDYVRDFVVGAPQVPPTLNLSTPPAIDEGQALDLAGSFTDPDAGDAWTATVNYGDGGGTLPLTLQADKTFALSHTYDNDGSYAIVVAITDSDENVTSQSVTLNVSEVAPTAAFGNSGPVLEGGSATVSFTGAYDPSNADAAAGYRYSYDFNNDGVFEIANSLLASAGVPAALMSGGSALRVIRGRIASAADGAYRDYITTLEVHNVLPTLNVNLDASFFTPATYGAAGSFTDPGTTETYTATVDYGDGAGPQPLTLQANRTFSLSRDYAAGVYTVTVSLSDGGAPAVTATGTVTVSAPVIVPLTASGMDIACERGVFFSKVIAVFTPLEGTTTEDYLVSVDWGVVLEGGYAYVTADESGQFFVRGQQTYSAAGTFDLTTTISVATLDGRVGEATVHGTATVSEPVPSMDVYDFYPSQYQSWDGTIAWVNDPSPSGNLAIYSATIDWGDGQISPGVVEYWGEGSWLYVSASHTYQEYGEFPFQVTFQKAPPKSPIQTVVQSAVAYVANAPLDGMGLNFLAEAMTPLQAILGRFWDADPTATASLYEATIDWGDGSNSPGNIIDDPENPGQFLVTGAASYPLAGDYTINVHVTDPGDGVHISELYLQSLAHIRPAALQVTMQPVQVLLGLPFDGLVATFTDPNLDGPQDVADFIATIDWGDGESSPGLISQVNGKTFSISGSHTYGQAGLFPLHVSVDTVPITDPIVNGGFVGEGFTGWTTGGLLTPFVYVWWGHSDQTSVYLGNSSYQDTSNNDSMLWQDFQVPEGNSTLAFWTYRYSADTAGDRQEALILDTDGQVLATIWSGLTWDNDWTRTAFDLTPFAGQVVRLRFNMHMDGDGLFSYIYLDDVGITRADKSGAADGAAIVTATGHQVFYNNSAWDGNDAAANADDDAAIATDKMSLLPGGTAGFANYTSYGRGINGLMVDVQSLAVTLTAADFIFMTGNSSDLSTWTAAPDPLSVTVRTGAGLAGSDRVTLIWADNNMDGQVDPNEAVANQWLQVTVLSDANGGHAGLAKDDVFYFGNAVGETGNTTLNAFVDGTDFVGVRDHPRNFLNRAPVTFAYDINRDGFVDGTDLVMVRDNGTNFLTALNLIAPPAPAGAVPGAQAPMSLAPETPAVIASVSSASDSPAGNEPIDILTGVPRLALTGLEAAAVQAYLAQPPASGLPAPAARGPLSPWPLDESLLAEANPSAPPHRLKTSAAMCIQVAAWNDGVGDMNHPLSDTDDILSAIACDRRI